ncbi:GTP-binding protein BRASSINAZOLE INSENSITIVE PALE GREEN 2, chloroplastic-like [Alnus glutinosa]|uniref:GTP-binding protein BRASSINAZOLE INSENSITIVE PALE GREEN 2, chloroplastic-like n=1 Tax=Alnus glutinosa TaxID=3517 RepID=UPI002D7907D7|nr:GTP-binding protein BRASSINAZOLE INSENSITIVE PALE GREEN 2, chloroplastic-like [Alnus glutinosa]
MDLPRIIRSIPRSPDSRIIFSKWGCDEGVKETDNNFKGVKRCVDDWNYEAVIEHVKDAWKRQGCLLKATRKWIRYHVEIYIRTFVGGLHVLYRLIPPPPHLPLPPPLLCVRLRVRSQGKFDVHTVKGFVNGIEGELDESDEGEDDLETGDEFDWDSDELEAKLMEEEDEEKLDLDGFAPAGVGYGNINEDTIEKVKKNKVPKAEKKKMAREAQKEKEEVTVCARCHSLRNYGQVKNQTAENLIPDFDFDRLIATRLMKPTGNASTIVVVMVVDCVDFDGSFPKRAAKSLFKALERARDDLKLGKRLPKLVLVATKVDLLPSQIPPAKLDRWVRHHAKAGGAPKISGVYLVSSRKDLGVKNLLSFVKELAGPRGNVWVIGAQNAGKSTLINALAKKEGAKVG